METFYTTFRSPVISSAVTNGRKDEIIAMRKAASRGQGCIIIQ